MTMTGLMKFIRSHSPPVLLCPGQTTATALAGSPIKPKARRLMTAPGVGPITALCFLATIDDPTRFNRKQRENNVPAGTPALV